jgi:hypothetical protein
MARRVIAFELVGYMPHPGEELGLRGTCVPFAKHWYADALGEAQRTDLSGIFYSHSRRREIVFSVCLAEAYLYEFVAIEVLHLKIDDIKKYFPLKSRDGVSKQYLSIPKLLYKDGLFPRLPDFGGPHGDEWNRIIAYRDGLIHANASRAFYQGQVAEEAPKPGVNDLSALQAGWAVRTVTERIRRLHEATDIAPPQWLLVP